MRLRLSYRGVKEEAFFVQSAADVIRMLRKTQFNSARIENVDNETVEMNREILGHDWKKTPQSPKSKIFLKV